MVFGPPQNRLSQGLGGMPVGRGGRVVMGGRGGRVLVMGGHGGYVVGGRGGLVGHWKPTSWSWP